MDDVPDTTDEADAPIIVPPPNQILRRTARTKIRKPNLSGDGGGHRFPASRRKTDRPERANSLDAHTSPTDGSSSGHGEVEPSTIPPLPSLRRKSRDEPEDYENRRLTYSEETSIYDAYADNTEDEKPARAMSPPARGNTDALSQLPPVPAIPPLLNLTPVPHEQRDQAQTAAPILHQPTPQRLLTTVLQQEQPPQPSRSPSPDAPTAAAAEIQRPDSRSSITSETSSFHGHAVPPSHMSPEKRKEKDKKSIWRKVGGGSDKASKKAAKDKETREKEKEKEREKEKDSGFFGSLFGGKKKQEEEKPSNLGGGAGPATAVALLGASKSSKAYSPSISPQLGNPYARYPIHVERAVYRLSHIKLANPRRPLYEQVLISNLMFWYLGVINKSQQNNNQNQNQTQASNQSTQSQQDPNQRSTGAASSTPDGTNPAAGSQEKEQQGQQERERAEKERLEKEREQQQRNGPRRGSLTKPVASSQGAPRQRAEMPVKGPQYHIQSQVIEQEYGSGGSSVPVARTSSAPPPTMNSQSYNNGSAYGNRNGSGAPTIQPVKSQSQSAQQQANGSYYGRSASVDMVNSVSQYGPSAQSQGQGQGQGGLPPGAMPPLSTNEQLWLATQSSSPPARQPLAATQPTAYNTQNNVSAEYGDYARGPSQAPPRSTRTPPPGQHYGGTSSQAYPQSQQQQQQQGQQYDWARPLDRPSGGKTPARSLSANAAPAPAPTHDGYGGHPPHGHHGGQTHHQGMLRKKPASAIAAPAGRYSAQRGPSEGNEEEDMPLAMWQQRRK